MVGSILCEATGTLKLDVVMHKPIGNDEATPGKLTLTIDHALILAVQPTYEADKRYRVMVFITEVPSEHGV